MTTITGRLLDIAGVAVANAAVTARLVAASTVLAAGGGEVVQQVSTYSDATGVWSLTLTPISSLVAPSGAYYAIEAPGGPWWVTVPASGSWSVDQVLVADPGALGALALTQSAADARYDPLGAAAAEAALRSAGDAASAALVTAEAALRVSGDASAVQLATVDAKGDLLVGTADNTVARLAVGTDGYPLRSRSSATSGVAWERAVEWAAVDHGYLAWTADPVLCTGSTTPGTQGRLEFTRVHLPMASSVTNIAMLIQTGGGTLTSGQCFAALYTAARALVAVTADQSTAWLSPGLVTMPLAGGPYPLAAGDYYIAFWYRGTTAPTFDRQGNVNATLCNVTLASPNLRMGSADTGLTTTAPGPMGVQTVQQVAWWAALS
jgi:hypothetical protein